MGELLDQLSRRHPEAAGRAGARGHVQIVHPMIVPQLRRVRRSQDQPEATRACSPPPRTAARTKSVRREIRRGSCAMWGRGVRPVPLVGHRRPATSSRLQRFASSSSMLQRSKSPRQVSAGSQEHWELRSPLRKHLDVGAGRSRGRCAQPTGDRDVNDTFWAGTLRGRSTSYQCDHHLR